MSPHTKQASRSRPLDKALFQSGLQCVKRLYLDYHVPEGMPAPAQVSLERQEAGRRLVELARQAFPRGTTTDPDDMDRAVEQTKELIAAGQPVAIFDAAFRCEGVDVRADVVIPNAAGGVDLFEVKSGIKIKARYLKDVALQVHVIERGGVPVRSATVLHLNARYRHRGGSNYPVQQLFKYANVSDKVRRVVPMIDERLATFRAVLGDPMTRELPTGTWCTAPFPCIYLPACREEGVEHPLIDLPDLTREQESELHQQGVEDVTRIDVKQKGLSLLQRRALRAIAENAAVVEPFVARELRDLPPPLHFLDFTTVLQVLPWFERSRPWQHIPFQWSDTIRHADGRSEALGFSADGKDDPRPAFLRSLADAVRGRGTLVMYGPAVGLRLRELLDDVVGHKAEARALLGMPHFDLGQLVHAGVYHPGFRASFALEDVHRALTGKGGVAELEVRDESTAAATFQKLLQSRARAPTREKAVRPLQAFGRWRSAAIAAVYEELLSR